MGFIEEIYERARANKKRVAVPECTNPGMMRSCVRAAADGLAEIIFVGDGDTCKRVAKENHIDLSLVTIADSKDGEYVAGLVERYGELSKRGFSKKSIEKRIVSPLYMALVMEAVGDADCTFGGLDTTTMEFVMAAQGTLGLAPGVTAPSGILLMEIEGYKGAQGNVFGMADGAVNTEPSADVLASIAVSCCDTFHALTGKEAFCGFLSYSTDGSGNSPSVFRVREALEKAKALRPDLQIDGEFQADAAIVERVAKKKVKRESLKSSTETM